MGKDFFDMALMYIIIDAHSSQCQITLLIMQFDCISHEIRGFYLGNDQREFSVVYSL